MNTRSNRNTSNSPDQARHARPATAPPKGGPEDSGAQRECLDRLADELLGVCGEALKHFGATPDRPRTPSVSRAHYARELLKDAGTVAMLHTRWQRQYPDEQGDPKEIAVTGPAPSFEALCRECDLDSRSDRLLDLACRFGLCSRTARNRLTYGSDVVLLTGERTLMLARAVVTVERFLSTCVHNAQPGRRKSESMGDRTTEVRLSKSEFDRISKRIRRNLSSFIESTDRQLLASTARRTRRSSNLRLQKMSGVTAFAFRD